MREGRICPAHEFRVNNTTLTGDPRRRIARHTRQLGHRHARLTGRVSVMREERPDGADIMDEPHTRELSNVAARRTGPEPPHRHRRARGWVPRAWAALAWTVGGIALYALLLRIALTENVSSDPANNVLQAWDMVHGHLLLHGWILGDVTFYTFELPLLGIIELFFGVHTIALHVALALVYLIITVFATAIAVTGSRGAARAARAVGRGGGAGRADLPEDGQLDPDLAPRSHRHERLPAPPVLADRPPRPRRPRVGRALYRAAALPDLGRRAAQRRDRALRGGARDRRGLRLPAPGGAEAGEPRRGEPGRGRACPCRCPWRSAP